MLMLLSVVALFFIIERYHARAAPLSSAARAAWLAAAVACVAVGVSSAPPGAVLAKCIARLAMPTGFLWCLGLAAAGVAWVKGRRRLFFIILAFWCAYSVAGNRYIGDSALRWLARDYQTIKPFEAEPFEAIFVMGGGGLAWQNEPYVSDAGDRIVLAARLYHRGQTPHLIASGSSVPGMSDKDDGATATAMIWRDLGVPESAISVISAPYNSRQEIKAYAEMTAARGWRRVGLVTSSWHLRRAMRLCEANQFSPHPLPAERRRPEHYDGLYTLIPDGHGFESVYRASWELLGAFVNR